MKRAKDFRAEARRALKGHWKLALVVGFIAVLLGGAAGMVDVVDLNLNYGDGGARASVQIFGQNLDLNRILQGGDLTTAAVVTASLLYFSVIVLAIALIRIIIGCVVEVGYAKFNMDLIDGEEGKIETLFRYFKQWGTMLWAGILQIVYILLWSLLFIIPGIIAAYRYAMTSYILAENPEMEASEAIARSKEMMKGNKWRLFCMQFSFIGWDILSSFTLGIGDLWLTPYKSAADAAFYRDLVPLQREADPQTTEEAAISE